MDSYIHERQIPAPIELKKTSSFENKERSLKEIIHDPNMMSPPNDFMEKLIKRMDCYYSPKKQGKITFNFEDEKDKQN